MLGVSMDRLCPDQTKTEAARKAYVDAALYVPPPAVGKPYSPPRSTTAAVKKTIAGYNPRGLSYGYRSG